MVAQKGRIDQDQALGAEISGESCPKSWVGQGSLPHLANGKVDPEWVDHSKAP